MPESSLISKLYNSEVRESSFLSFLQGRFPPSLTDRFLSNQDSSVQEWTVKVTLWSLYHCSSSKVLEYHNHSCYHYGFFLPLLYSFIDGICFLWGLFNIIYCCMRNDKSLRACAEREGLSHIERLLFTCLETKHISVGGNNKSYIWALVMDLKFSGIGREETKMQGWHLDIVIRSSLFSYTKVYNFTIFQVIGISTENSIMHYWISFSGNSSSWKCN